MLITWLQIQDKMRKLFLELRQKEKRESAIKEEGKMLGTLLQLSLQDSCRYCDIDYDE